MSRKAWEEGHMRNARESPETEDKGVDSGSEQLVASEEQSKSPSYNSYALTLKSKVVFRL